MGERIPGLFKSPYSTFIEYGGVTYAVTISNRDSRTWNAAIDLPDRNVIVTANSEQEVIAMAKDRLAKIK